MKKEKIFGTSVGAPSEEQLQLYFQLTDFDKEIINEMRLPSTKLGFAVQLGTVRFLGTFFTDFSKIPLEVIIYLANQLSIDPREFDSYSRKMTISQHAQLIKERYSYRNFQDSHCQKFLYDWLLSRASRTTETTEMLSDMLLKKCLEEKILLPGVYIFQRFIFKIVEQAEDQLMNQLSLIPSEEGSEKLLNLLSLMGTPVQGAFTKMDILRAPLIDEGRKEITRGFHRLKEFQQFHTSEWDFSTIPEGKVKHLATYAFKAKSSLIQRMSIQKKLALLVALVYEYEKIATDELLTALIKYYELIFRRAKNKESKERLRTLKDLDRAAFTLSEIVELFLDDSIEIDCLRSRVFDQYPAEDIVNAVFQVKKLVKNEQEPIAIAELIQSYRKIRKFIPLIIETLTIENGHYGEECMAVWYLIRRRFPKSITFRQFESVENHIPKKWAYYIHSNPNEVNQSMLILCTSITNMFDWIHCQHQIKKLFLHTKNFLFLLYGEIIKWLRPTVFVILHHNVPYILEVIQNILAVVVESHFTTLFLINILDFMEWLFQELCVILCTCWMVF
ncbi:transposase [Enterococcus faecium]|nr:transposase [Enterococcus faecium]MBK4846661.1 transposase [Enterococcus faecium]